MPTDISPWLGIFSGRQLGSGSAFVREMSAQPASTGAVAMISDQILQLAIYRCLCLDIDSDIGIQNPICLLDIDPTPAVQSEGKQAQADVYLSYLSLTMTT